jgi:hypothetical protein
VVNKNKIKNIMKRIVKLTEEDIKNMVRKTMDQINVQGNEHHDRGNRYMFFSNLQQMRRQCDILLDMDPQMVEGILDNGHDWAQDHISEAKNNMDQVFDFLMNESKKSGMELSMNIDDNDMMNEKWSKEYKNSIDCNNPKGFSQRAHCQGRKKR